MTAKKFPISSENSINTKVKENKHKQANKQTKVRKHDLPQTPGSSEIELLISISMD
jgi:hypothetical protein